jgi:chaperonin GroEL
MQPKIFTGEQESRRLILEGAKMVYDAVKSTYSPKSGNVAIELNWGQPVISHDGVTVARAIADSDGRKNTGIRLLVEASEQTNRNAGDGTSATVILAYNLLAEANKLIAAGYNPMELRRGMERAAVDVIKAIDDVKRDVTDADLKDIATISSGSEAIGSLIAGTIIAVGQNSGVTVEEYQGTNIEAEIVEGFHFGRGADSPYMWNELDLRRAAYDNVFVLVVNRTIKEINEVKPILQLLNQQEYKNLLIVGNVQGRALEVIIANKLQGLCNVVTVSPVAIGNQTSEFLSDVAAVTGARVVNGEFDLDKLDIDKDFGWAGRIVSKENTTTIFEGDANKEEVAARIKAIHANIKATSDATVVERLEGRLSKISGKIGVLKVGAPTETDRKEKILRVEDAVMAARAAREDGIVAGGATTLLRIGAAGARDIAGTTDEQIGYKLVFDAIQTPFKILLNNTGIDDIGYHKHAVLKAEAGYGYNVRDLTDEPIDLIKAGVIDPAKVVKQAVQNAVANAGVLVTTNGIITFDKDEIRKDRVVQD